MSLFARNDFHLWTHWTNITLPFQNGLSFWCDVVKEKVYELGFFRGARELHVMKNQNSAKVCASKRGWIKVWFEIRVVVHVSRSVGIVQNLSDASLCLCQTREFPVTFGGYGLGKGMIMVFYLCYRITSWTTSNSKRLGWWRRVTLPHSWLNYPLIIGRTTRRNCTWDLFLSLIQYARHLPYFTFGCKLRLILRLAETVCCGFANKSNESALKPTNPSIQSKDVSTPSPRTKLLL